MKKHEHEFSIEKMAELLKVSRSGYYDFLGREVSAWSTQNEEFKKKIRIVYEKSRKVYVSPRVDQELRKQGEKISRRRVAQLMKKECLQAKMRKK